jgi:hypothetical protein
MLQSEEDAKLFAGIQVGFTAMLQWVLFPAGFLLLEGGKIAML